MVYEKKCSECGEVLDFGGRELKEVPEDALKFDDKLYCQDCVRKFVEFGTGNLAERIEKVEEKIEEIGYQVGMDIHF